MSLSYCVGLVYRHPVLVERGVELSSDVEADALVQLSVRIADGSLHMHAYALHIITLKHCHIVATGMTLLQLPLLST